MALALVEVTQSTCLNVLVWDLNLCFKKQWNLTVNPSQNHEITYEIVDQPFLMGTVSVGL